MSSIDKLSDIDILASKLSKKVQSDIMSIDNINKDEYPPKVFIFTSIDLVNSTNYKSEDKNWPNVFSEFFGILESIFKKNPNIHVWKYVGDEILFYQEVKSIDDILKAPSKTFRNMEQAQSLLYNQKPKCKNRLFLKSTLWIAATKKANICIEKESKQFKLYESINNVIPELTDSFMDFIGCDIDEGFRISKFSSQNKLVLDASLAYLLYKNSSRINSLCDYNVNDRIKIVGYKKLKGIWNNRLYPIIWYHKNWSNQDDMFLYDEHEISEISNDLRLSNYSYEPICKIEKILDEVNLKDTKIACIENLISNCDTNKLSDPPLPHKMIEFHCVAICFDTKSDKALIVKRCSNTPTHPAKWEFGCAKVNRYSSITDTLKLEYNKDFRININVLMDNTRIDDPEPIPIAVYNIPTDSFMHKGVIFVATICDSPINITLTSKHLDYRFISESDIDSFSEDTIPDFKDSLRKAFKLYNEYKLNGAQ